MIDEARALLRAVDEILKHPDRLTKGGFGAEEVGDLAAASCRLWGVVERAERLRRALEEPDRTRESNEVVSHSKRTPDGEDPS